MFFDFCAAFPSVAHAYIFIILEAIGVPAGLLNYFRALYHNNACYANFGNGTEFLYMIQAALPRAPFSSSPLTHSYASLDSP